MILYINFILLTNGFINFEHEATSFEIKLLVVPSEIIIKDNTLGFCFYLCVCVCEKMPTLLLYNELYFSCTKYLYLSFIVYQF